MSRLSPEQQALVVDYWPNALEVASWFAGRFPWHPVDWEGEVAVGLCEAALSYDRGRGTTFWTHGWNRCRGACLGAMRTERRRGFRFYGRRRTWDDDKAIPCALRDDVAARGRPVGWELDAADEAEALLRGLPARHAGVLREVFFRSTPITVLSREAGIGERQAYKLRGQALQMLREAI
jgi:hypothetical protein